MYNEHLYDFGIVCIIIWKYRACGMRNRDVFPELSCPIR